MTELFLADPAATADSLIGPLGPILVDDVLDMLVPDKSRFRFPRRLS